MADGFHVKPADITVLPVIRLERAGIDLCNQPLLPASDRRKVVELRRVRELKAFARAFARPGHSRQGREF